MATLWRTIELMRPATATRARPQSAAALDGGGASLAKEKASDELIRDLESKVRRVVEQKRGESDRLRFAVAKKRDDVERAKLVLQDLLKDSGALGIHYDLRVDNQQDHGEDEDETRLQPIASISRRPVYSKHTNIHELEEKLERRAKEAHLVHRRTLVLEHIKKRLLNERVEVAQATNQLKQIYTDLTHETNELQKKDIAAAEAVSQAQTRLVQQRADMAASMRKFRRELALRHKWAREKAKFEKYYNDQLQAALAKASTAGVASSHVSETLSPHTHHGTASVPTTSQPKRSPTSFLKMRRSSSHLALEEKALEDSEERRHREAFQRIGVDPRVEAIDPEQIIRICLSHEELRKELDAKHDEAVERIATLREQISKARSLAREDVPLSKRGTSQKIETKQLEISSVERQLATVVDQYMFVENTVRPIKIGLQQVLQNVSSATVNVDNMAALEKCLVESCEEMMRMLRANSPPPIAEETLEGGASVSASIPEDEAVEHDVDESEPPSTLHQRTGVVEASPAKDPEKHAEVVVSLESFTSPFNVRIAPKKRENYYIPGLTKPSASSHDDEDLEENDFEVMDRAMVKRISSVVVCTSAGKKLKSPSCDESAAGSTHHQYHHSH